MATKSNSSRSFCGESLEDVRALVGDDYEKSLIPEDRLPLLSRYDARAAHYEVVSTNEPAPR